MRWRAFFKDLFRVAVKSGIIYFAAPIYIGVTVPALFPGKVAPEKRPVTPNDKKWPQFWKFRVIYSEMAQSRRPGWDKPEITTPRQKK